MLIGVDNFCVEVESPNLFLRCLRGITGLSRRELAEKCEISPETVKKIEEGGNLGSPDTWARIARVMGEDTLDVAAGTTGAATDILSEVNESIALRYAEEIRLFYLIAPSGKLVVYDSDYFDEDADGGFIVASLGKAKAMLEWQQKELGS